MTARRLKTARFIERRRKKMQEFLSLSDDMRVKNLILFMEDVRVRPLEQDKESESEASTSESSTIE